MNKSLAPLGDVVRDALNTVGISENSASERTGIPRSTLKRRLVTGDFRLGELWLVAELLDTTPVELQALAEERVA